jgi:octaprenyl-diphosphate synthase
MEAALALVGEDLKNVELQFKKDLQSDVPLIRKVGEYVLSSGGKSIHPAFLLRAANQKRKKEREKRKN